MSTRKFLQVATLFILFGAFGIFLFLRYPSVFTDLVAKENPIGVENSINEQKETWKQNIAQGKKTKLTSADIENLTAGQEVSKDYVVVLLKNTLSSSDISAVAQAYDSDIPKHQKSHQREIGNGTYVAMKVPEGKEVNEFLTELNADSNVLFAEPSYKRSLFWTPNDTDFINQWQLQDITGGTYSIEMPKAWTYVDRQLDAQIGAGDNYGGRATVVVAVIDTGLAYEDRTVSSPGTYEDGWDFDPIPDKPTSLWTNLDEIGANATDDDGNGYIDDFQGVNIDDYYNYEYIYAGHTAEDGYPDDDYGHGTLVSGIIAGNTNNTTAGAGIAFKVLIMPIKIFDYQGDVWSESVIDSLAYAIDNGAHVINMSFGGSSPSTVEEALVDEAVALGIIPVAAAGNNNAIAAVFSCIFLSNKFCFTLSVSRLNNHLIINKTKG